MGLPGMGAALALRQRLVGLTAGLNLDACGVVLARTPQAGILALLVGNYATFHTQLGPAFTMPPAGPWGALGVAA